MILTPIHSNFNNWKKYFIENGFKFDIDSLNSSSYRCSKSVCDFIKQVGIDIESNKIQNYEVREVIDEQEINLIMKNDSIKKLFYQKHYNYNCNSQNWGNSKGLEFNCVCVVLNKATYEKFKTKSLSKLAKFKKSDSK